MTKAPQNIEEQIIEALKERPHSSQELAERFSMTDHDMSVAIQTMFYDKRVCLMWHQGWYE